MNDTDPRIVARIKTLMQQKSGAEKFLMGCSMYKTAKALILSSLRARYPHISSEELKYEIFLRFYMNDYKPEQLKKIRNYFTRGFL